MSIDVVAIILIYAGIFLLYLASKKWLVRLRFGVVGLILILQPAAMATYRDLPGLAILVSATLGVIVLLADVRHQAKHRQPFG